MSAIRAHKMMNKKGGVVDSDGVYHYVNVTTGSIDKTIEVPENGSYTLMIRNKSSKSVVVTGIVGY